MHIVIVAQQWAPETGVPQRRGRWMVDQLQSAGHRVTIVAPPPHYPEGQLLSDLPEDQGGARTHMRSGEYVYRARFFPHTHSIYSRVIDQAVVSLTSISAGLAATKEHPADLFIATAPPLPAAFTGFALKVLRRKPLLIDLRDAWPELVPFVATADPSASRLKTLIKRAIQPIFSFAAGVFGWVLHHCDAVMTTSAWHAEHVRETYGRRTAVVSNLPLVNNESVTPPTTEPASSTLRVLYTGTVGRAQGLDNAVRAAKLVAERGVDIELRIVGDGAHLSRIRRLAKQLQAPVTCTGRIPRAAVAAHYAWCDTTLVHLQDWEPLHMTVPSKIFEAIGTGKHVTAAVAGEAADIITRSGSGHAVPPMDPEALADLWVRLARDRNFLHVAQSASQPTGRAWLAKEEARTKPAETLLNIVNEASCQP